MTSLIVKNRAGAGVGKVDINGAMFAAGGTALTVGATVLGADDVAAGMANAITKGWGLLLAGTAPSLARTADAIVTLASGVASASTAAVAVMKPSDSRMSSQRDASCARAFLLMFNTPFPGR